MTHTRHRTNNHRLPHLQRACRFSPLSGSRKASQALVGGCPILAKQGWGTDPAAQANSHPPQALVGRVRRPDTATGWHGPRSRGHAEQQPTAQPQPTPTHTSSPRQGGPCPPDMGDAMTHTRHRAHNHRLPHLQRRRATQPILQRISTQGAPHPAQEQDLVPRHLARSARATRIQTTPQQAIPHAISIQFGVPA